MKAKKLTSPWLIVGALGVVFGDLGTSPLYALRAVFDISHLPLNAQSVQGIISLIIWSVTLVVTVKYVLLIMRANNKGEGGVMALIGLIRQSSLNKRFSSYLVLCGLIGVSLFYGDSIITPAISVLSAVEGTRLVLPRIASWTVPVTALVLTGLFLLQPRGTGTIGRLFGPIMCIWFLISALAGLAQIIQQPIILTALLPTSAISFFIQYPLFSFVAMGGVVLAITGVEALYADMGHFGRPAISRAWLWLVFPSLTLTYLGQGALVSAHPEAINSAYFSLFPAMLQTPAIILATLATLIASQAVISGAFSLTRQAAQLGFAPRMAIRHTSVEEAGQIYVPVINWAIAVMVILLVFTFGSSANLASAFGMAVSGAILVDSLLFLVVASYWRHAAFFVTIVLLLAIIDLVFVSSSISKLLHGAWLPISIAIFSFALLSTWYKGRGIIADERFKMEGSLHKFVKKLHRAHITRIPGYAVYLGHHAGNTPLALHTSVDQLHELHEQVVIVTVDIADVAHIPLDERVVFDGLGYPDDNISHVILRFGYKDTPNVPLALEKIAQQGSEIDFDPYREAFYFISHGQPIITRNKKMAGWRKLLYVFMDRNAINASEFFKLPLDRTAEMTTYIEL